MQWIKAFFHAWSIECRPRERNSQQEEKKESRNLIVPISTGKQLVSCCCCVYHIRSTISQTNQTAVEHPPNWVLYLHNTTHYPSLSPKTFLLPLASHWRGGRQKKNPQWQCRTLIRCTPRSLLVLVVTIIFCMESQCTIFGFQPCRLHWRVSASNSIPHPPLHSLGKME